MARSGMERQLHVLFLVRFHYHVTKIRLNIKLSLCNYSQSLFVNSCNIIMVILHVFTKNIARISLMAI